MTKRIERGLCKMKKISGVLLSFVLLLPLFISTLAIGVTANATKIETQNILLHKRIFRDRDYVEQFEDALYQNTGDVVSGASNVNAEMLQSSQGLNGATFVLVDVTDYYYEKAEILGYQLAEAAVQDNLSRLTVRNHAQAGEAEIALEKGFSSAKIVDQGVTEPKEDLPSEVLESDLEDTDGFLLFENVPKMSNGKSAAYLIVETEVEDSKNVDLHKWAAKMFLSFPVIRDDGTEFNSEYLHLYPKNLGYVRDPWFMKLGRTLAGDYTPLEGTEFVLFQLNDAGEREYFIPDTTPMSMDHQWVAGIDTDAQGNADYDSLIDNGIEIYRSNEYGIVSMGGVLLASGKYYFEEVKAVPGYLLTTDALSIEVEIPSSWWDEEGNYLPVMVNGQAMAEPEPNWSEVFAEGFSMEKALAAAYINENGFEGDGLPYVYNDEVPVLEKELLEEKQDFAYGEIINYRLSTRVPQFPEFYQFVRIQDESDGRLKIVEDSIKVRVGKVTNDYLSASEVNDLMHITISENHLGFTADLNLAYLSDSSKYIGEELFFDYQMIILENSEADSALVNTAKLVFKHTDYDYEEYTDEKKVYTGGHRFLKVDIDKTAKVLPGAQFIALNTTNQYLSIVDGAVTWTDNKEEAKIYTADGNGEFTIMGLKYGNYQLQEVVAPEGYDLLKEKISFSIEKGSFSVGGVATSPLTVGNSKSKKPTGTLPQTGEVAFGGLIVIGILLVIYAWTTYKRKKLKAK